MEPIVFRSFLAGPLLTLTGPACWDLIVHVTRDDILITEVITIRSESLIRSHLHVVLLLFSFKACDLLQKE